MLDEDSRQYLFALPARANEADDALAAPCDRIVAMPSRALSDEEVTLLHLKPSQAKRVVACSFAIPWAPSEGLFVFDLFGGGEPVDTLLPADLERMPEVSLYTSKDERAFLAQRLRDAPIATWRKLGEVSVDTASVCIAPRRLAEHLRDDLGAIEANLPTTSDPHVVSFAEASAVRVPVHDDGVYDLYVGLDKNAAAAAWVLRFGLFGSEEWEAKPALAKLSPELKAFSNPRSWFALAGRRAPELTFEKAAKAAGVRWPIPGMRVVEVEPNDFHWYKEDLARIGLPEPRCIYRARPQYEPGAIEGVKKRDFEAMLRIFEAVAASCRGILCGTDAEVAKTIDYGT